MIVMGLGWISMLYGKIGHSFLVFLVATLAFAILSKKHGLIERLAIGMIIFGMFSLCQPFTIVLYRSGFQTLLTGTLAFIVVSHKPAPNI